MAEHVRRDEHADPGTNSVGVQPGFPGAPPVPGHGPVLPPFTGLNPTLRLQMELEAALLPALQWTSQQPSGEPLWAEIRATANTVLEGFFLAGMLQGTIAREAYSVTCDRTTMTQNDIDNGRINLVIGFAPVKPAEFVILRIGLWAKKP